MTPMPEQDSKPQKTPQEQIADRLESILGIGGVFNIKPAVVTVEDKSYLVYDFSKTNRPKTFLLETPKEIGIAIDKTLDESTKVTGLKKGDLAYKSSSIVDENLTLKIDLHAVEEHLKADGTYLDKFGKAKDKFQDGIKGIAKTVDTEIAAAEQRYKKNAESLTKIMGKDVALSATEEATYVIKVGSNEKEAKEIQQKLISFFNGAGLNAYPNTNYVRLEARDNGDITFSAAYIDLFRDESLKDDYKNPRIADLDKAKAGIQRVLKGADKPKMVEGEGEGQGFIDIPEPPDQFSPSGGIPVLPGSKHFR